MSRSPGAGGRNSVVDWSYVSGFFDGEGAIHVSTTFGSNLLTVSVTVCQKSAEVLQLIRSFLLLSGIYSVVYHYASGMYSLSIVRVSDVIRFLGRVRSIVKKRQVVAALNYMDGRTSGNTFLKVLDEEYVAHKRKTSPLRVLGPSFPMKRTDAIEISAQKSAEARIRGNRRAFIERMKKRVTSLPNPFEVTDIERVIGVSKSRAQVLGNLMVREGFAVFRFERVPPRFRKKVFTKVGADRPAKATPT